MRRSATSREDRLPSATEEARRTAALAAPLVVGQLSQLGLGLGASTALGVLGRAELAGGALGMACFSTALVICNGLLSPVATLGAESEASGDRRRVGVVAAIGLVIALGLSGVVVSGLLGIARGLSHLVEDPVIVREAASFLAVAAWGFPFAVGGLVLRNLATAIGRTTAFAVYSALGALVGTAAAHVAVRGVAGSGARSVVCVGAIVACAHALVFVAMGAHSVAARWVGPRAFAMIGRQRDVAALVLRIGVPVGVLYGLESGMFSVTTLWASQLGVDSVAAHHIAVQCSYVTFMVPSGIGMATAARVGSAFSRGDRRGVVTASGVGLASAVLFMATTGLVLWIAPRAVVGVFLDPDDPANGSAVSIAYQALAAVAVFQVADAVQGVVAGALRGLRDTKIPMALGIVSYWGIGVVLAYALGLRAGFGVPGLWWGLAAGLAAAAIALSLRLVTVARRVDRQ